MDGCFFELPEYLVEHIPVPLVIRQPPWEGQADVHDLLYNALCTLKLLWTSLLDWNVAESIGVLAGMSIYSYVVAYSNA